MLPKSAGFTPSDFRKHPTLLTGHLEAEALVLSLHLLHKVSEDLAISASE